MGDDNVTCSFGTGKPAGYRQPEPDLVFGNDSHNYVTGNRNISSVFGDRSGADADKDDQVSTAVGNDQHNTNTGVNNDSTP